MRIDAQGHIIGKPERVCRIKPARALPIVSGLPRFTKEPKRDSMSILRQSEANCYKSKRFPMDLSAGTWLTPMPKIETIRKWTKIPEAFDNARDYVRQFDDLNGLIPANIEWVRCEYLAEVYISEDLQQCA